MALITSAATGNFSAGATWTGGVVPTVGDEARASTGHTVTIDVNTTCDEVSNAGTGIFTLASGVTLTANVTHKSTTVNRNLLQFTAASPAVGTIVGNILGATVSSSSVYGAVINTSSGALTITGNVTGGTGAVAVGANNNSSGSLTVTGNVTASSAASSYGIYNASTGSITITGNVTGGSGSTAPGAQNQVTGILTINGIATGGTGSSAHGVNNISTGNVFVTRAVGNAFGPGNTAGLSSATGANNTSTGIIEVQELEFGQYGMSPVLGPGIRLKKVAGNLVTFPYVDAGAAKTLVDATQGQMPAATDVRNGVSYASGALTGSAFIPLASSVASGVPVDATTGTATLTAADVRAAIGMASANLDTQLADLPTASENADAVWNEVMSGHTTAGTYGGRIVRSTNANNELQINAQNHAAANVHQFQTAVIAASAFDASAVTLFTGAMRTELTPELTEITEVHAIHGLDIANALTVTPTSRTSGAITQSITGDGTTNTVVTRV